MTTTLLPHNATTERAGANSPCALGRELGFWHLRFQGQPAIFKHELGALYVAYLLLNPPRPPLKMRRPEP